MGCLLSFLRSQVCRVGGSSRLQDVKASTFQDFKTSDRDRKTCLSSRLLQNLASSFDQASRNQDSRPPDVHIQRPAGTNARKCQGNKHSSIRPRGSYSVHGKSGVSYLLTFITGPRVQVPPLQPPRFSDRLRRFRIQTTIPSSPIRSISVRRLSVLRAFLRRVPTSGSERAPDSPFWADARSRGRAGSPLDPAWGTHLLTRIRVAAGRHGRITVRLHTASGSKSARMELGGGD